MLSFLLLLPLFSWGFATSVSSVVVVGLGVVVVISIPPPTSSSPILVFVSTHKNRSSRILIRHKLSISLNHLLLPSHSLLHFFQQFLPLLIEQQSGRAPVHNLPSATTYFRGRSAEFVSHKTRLAQTLGNFSPKNTVGWGFLPLQAAAAGGAQLFSFRFSPFRNSTTNQPRTTSTEKMTIGKLETFTSWRTRRLL